MRRHPLWLLAAMIILAWSVATAAEDPILVVGHKNPDMDSIISAIAVAHLKIQQGHPAIPIAQGIPNLETRYVLETFKLAPPRVQTSVAGHRVILVDHSDYPLAPDDLVKAEVVGLVDHHKLGGLSTEKPIEVWVFPVGCTSTIITRMYTAAGIAIPRDLAGGMLGAIISDTTLFKSPTTTQEDRDTAVKLAKLAGIEDIQAFGKKQLEARSAIKGLSAMDLLTQDLKTFSMNQCKVGVAQVELVDLSIVFPLKEDFLKAMRLLKDEGYHSVFLMLTDITKEGTELLFVSDDLSIVDSAFGIKMLGSSTWLPGVVSRKKQVIPSLEKAFKEASSRPGKQ